MPLWLIFHPDGTFEDDVSKQALSMDVTNLYTSLGLPTFYVVVDFIKMSGNTMWVGGKKPNKEKPFIRVVINHVAVVQPNEDEAYRTVTTGVDKILKPHVADKGYDWEYHVDETDRRLWKSNGLILPAFQSEKEKMWAKENRAAQWQKDYT